MMADLGNREHQSQSPPHQRARRDDETETLADHGQLSAATRIEKIIGLDIELLAEVVGRSATPLVENTVDTEYCLPGMSSNDKAWIYEATTTNSSKLFRHFLQGLNHSSMVLNYWHSFTRQKNSNAKQKLH